MTSNVKNTADLRNLLLESIEGVRKGKVDHRQAQAISALSSRILQSARLDLDVMKMASEKATAAPASVSLMGEQGPQRKRISKKVMKEMESRMKI
jgi:hypothetical protein